MFLFSSLAEDNSGNGLEHELQVKSGASLLDVLNIALDPFVELHIASALGLADAGEAALYQ